MFGKWYVTDKKHDKSVGIGDYQNSDIRILFLGASTLATMAIGKKGCIE